MDGGAWWATVHGVTKSQTRLSDFTTKKLNIPFAAQFWFTRFSQTVSPCPSHLVSLYIKRKDTLSPNTGVCVCLFLAISGHTDFFKNKILKDSWQMLFLGSSNI